MIRIQRKYVASSIPVAFRGVKRVAKQRLLLDALRAGAPVANLVWKSSVWKPAKKALKKETGGKCAYCEAPAGGRSTSGEEKGGLVAHCDVEHFRPKNLYWWLAHNFENYTFSCQICNQSYKSDKFPAATPLVAPFVVGTSESDAQLNLWADLMAPDPLNTTARSAWESNLAAEDADLADPLHENPELLFKYEADETLKQVSIAPRAAGGRSRARAASTIEVIGLDREELRFARWDVYRPVRVFKDVLGDPGIGVGTRTAVTEQLGVMMSLEQAFSGMVRYFVKDVWGLGISSSAQPLNRSNRRQ